MTKTRTPSSRVITKISNFNFANIVHVLVPLSQNFESTFVITLELLILKVHPVELNLE